jgi:fructosamine-3-kinase
MWNRIAEHITQTTGQSFAIVHRKSVSGGCINQGYAISDPQQTYFVKLNQASQFAMFEAEAIALRQQWETQTIRVPKPICYGVEADSTYLVLEWLELGRGNGAAWEQMGRQLAAMHRVTSEQGFGWQQNNTIGATPQVNPWTADWTEFFRDHRIGYQLQLAERRGGHFPQGQTLLAQIPHILAGHSPTPAMVHGDLWSGNASVTKQGESVIFDPALYFGDREVDIAMTELFGGFPAEFYRGYNQAYPLDAGYQARKTLYNLYHILNHFNLFGGSYESQANSMIRQLV